jgi:O-acetyl-ADP-ribose deacetylase (regulator of RNase III)
MEFQVNDTTIRLIQGDITQQQVDAIVNAANSSLVGGGGVDGAIREAGGPAIEEECEVVREKRGRLPTGEAVRTTGGQLPAPHVIHTVGPRWKGGDEGEPEKLANAYKNSLQCAVDNDLKTVAFPSISTGAYGYPINRAADVAFQAISDFIFDDERNDELDEIRFVLFSEKDMGRYREAAERYLEQRDAAS